jgi:hypothetical protein
VTVVHVEYPVRGAVGNQKFGSKIKIEGRCVCWLTVMAELVMEFLDFKIDFLLNYVAWYLKNKDLVKKLKVKQVSDNTKSYFRIFD